MSDELKLAPCPFCGGEARIESNRDWHKLFAAHDDDCVFEADDHMLMYPAQPGYLIQIAEDWNRRATPSPSTAPTCQTCAGSRVDPGGLAICRDCGTAPTVEVDELDHDAEMFAMLESDAAQEGAIHKMDGAATWAAFQGWLCARRAALASKPTAREAARQSIDTPEFRKLLGDLVRRASYNISGKASPAALIAHIDTWGGAAPAAGNTAQPKDSMAE